MKMQLNATLKYLIINKLLIRKRSHLDAKKTTYIFKWNDLNDWDDWLVSIVL